MGVYKLSKAAALDLENIYEYGILNFGIDQARKYLTDLQRTMESLAKNTGLGRTAYEFSPQLRRFNHRSHLLFYLPTQSGIFVIRILHHSMDFEQHL